MAVPETLTWDLEAADGGPRRPSLDDVGEAALENHAKYPPVAPTMPTAEMGNQWQMQIAAMGKVVAAIKVSVRFSGGTPSVYKFSAPTGNLVTGDFTVTDNGNGDTTIAWPADKIPPAVAEHEISINGATPGIPAIETVSATSVRVRTLNAAGAATDLAFTITIN